MQVTTQHGIACVHRSSGRRVGPEFRRTRQFAAAGPAWDTRTPTGLPSPCAGHLPHWPWEVRFENSRLNNQRYRNRPTLSIGKNSHASGGSGEVHANVRVVMWQRRYVLLNIFDRILWPQLPPLFRSQLVQQMTLRKTS